MDENNVTKGGKSIDAGCLPILFVLLLIDLIGKALIWGIASLCGKEVPGLAMVVKTMAYVIFIPLGAIFLVMLIGTLYHAAVDFVRKIFCKDKEKGNENKETEDQRKDEA